MYDTEAVKGPNPTLDGTRPDIEVPDALPPAIASRDEGYLLLS
jgi:hypothetical protein